LTNVISIPTNSELAIFTTDGALSINEAKVKTTANSFIDLVKRSQNSFSLASLAAGVYTIDVITQKGSARAAYEGILVLGQDPSNVQTRIIIEQQIVEDNDDNNANNGNGSDGSCDRLSYPDICIRPFPPDLDCPEVPHTNFKVLPPDPHDFDREGDGIGCESGTTSISSSELAGNETLAPDPCLDNPDLPECPDPCIVNPEAEGCPEPPPPPLDPCEEDPTLPECQENTGDSSDGDDESDGDSSDNDNGDESDEGTDEGDNGNEDEIGNGSDDEGNDDNGDDNSGDGPVDFGSDGPVD
jgi:hypothetical protein